MSKRSLALFVAGIALGGLWIAYEARFTVSIPAPPDGNAVVELPALTPPPASSDSLEAYDGIIERPLFASNRRPPEAKKDDEKSGVATPARAKRPTALDQYRLTAVVQIGEDMAAVLEQPNEQPRKLRTGDRLGEWQVQQIDVHSVQLAAGAETQSLDLHRFDAPTEAQKTPVRRSKSRRSRSTRAPRQLPPSVKNRIRNTDEGEREGEGD